MDVLMCPPLDYWPGYRGQENAWPVRSALVSLLALDRLPFLFVAAGRTEKQELDRAGQLHCTLYNMANVRFMYLKLGRLPKNANVCVESC